MALNREFIFAEEATEHTLPSLFFWGGGRGGEGEREWCFVYFLFSSSYFIFFLFSSLTILFL